MSSSIAIGQVSESLCNLLKDKMVPPPKVTVLGPDESVGSPDPRINLFLYRIRENAHAGQTDWQVKPGTTNQLTPPPLSLNLYYLMTPFVTSDPELGNIAAHQILGEAMRVFAEFPVVPEPYLADGLEASREEIGIMLNALDMEELSNLWSTFSQPFRLSVHYEVSVVQLDLSTERTMAPRVRQVGVPGVEVPYRPPVVDRMEPASGRAGTTVTFHGRHLDGRRAWLRLERRQVASALPISGDSFQVTLPGAEDLQTGFHELRLDVSNLFRRAFLFEVTV